MGTRMIAIVSILAAVYALGSFLPGFPMIGVPGSRIDLTRSLEMGYGLLLGPIFGPFAAFLGNVVGKVVTGGGSALFFTPLSIVSSLSAAALGRRRVFGVRGWALAAIMLGAVIAGWYGTETGRAAPYYPLLHLTGLGLILVFRGKIADYVRSRDKVAVGVALSSYPSTLAGHMLGNLIFIVLFNPSPVFFVSILPISVVERIVLTILSIVIATPLIVVLRIIYPSLFSELSEKDDPSKAKDVPSSHRS